jgi:hypothetical protein
VGFEPTISVFEEAKTVHVLDSAATVIGKLTDYAVHTKGDGQGTQHAIQVGKPKDTNMWNICAKCILKKGNAKEWTGGFIWLSIVT